MPQQRICSLLRIQPPVILNRGLLGGSGSVLPTGDGWQVGAYFQKTSGTGAGFYVNEGSVTTASWRAVEAGTFTVGGTVAINITGTYTTGAIVITNASTHGIRVGAFTSSGAATNAMALDATTSTAVEIHGGITSDPGSGAMVRPLRSRLILATVGNVEAETYGIQGQLVAKSSNLGHWHGGVLGTIECQTALSVYNPLAGVGALVGRIGGSTITVQSSCYLAGVIALASSVGVSNSGVYAGLYVTKTSGATNFSHGAYIENSDIGVYVTGTPTTGVEVAGACTTAAINITVANLNCIKSVFNVGAQLGQYVQGIKMEHTRSADIQPSTGGWWGAQIVLNAGTGYTALDKTAYVLHCIFKGDATNPSAQTVNVARFETQSNGKVEDLLFVSANAGSTVEGDIARFVAHVAPTRSILAVQNGTVGSTPIGICVDIDETMTTGIQFNTGAAITNLLQITAAANTSYFLIADAEAGCLPNYSSAGSAIANLKVKIGTTDGYIKIYDAA